MAKLPTYDAQSEATRQKTLAYMDRTGLVVQDLAARIGYGHRALYFFLQGRYCNPLKVSSALELFMQQHPALLNAERGADGKLYETENVRAWRDIFYECLDRQRAAIVYGPPGIQKSFPVEHLIAELNRGTRCGSDGRSAYYIYCRQNIRPGQLLKRVARACGSSPMGDPDRILNNLRFDFGNRRTLLVFDEAQHLDIACLETVRELLDRLGCGLIFAGSHDLIRIFQRSIELEQWNRRLRHAVALPGMSESDARNIIAGELGRASERQVSKLIADASVMDMRRPNPEQPLRIQPAKYISAGRLFSQLQEIKEDERFRKQAAKPLSPAASELAS